MSLVPVPSEQPNANCAHCGAALGPVVVLETCRAGTLGTAAASLSLVALGAVAAARAARDRGTRRRGCE